MMLPTMLIVLLVLAVDASILSSSRLETCVNDGSEKMNCDTKMVLAVTIEHGQLQTENAQFTLSQVIDEKNTPQFLKKPWQVSWEKTPASWLYPLRYVQDVNNKPTERIMKVSGCVDNPNKAIEELTCGVAYSNRGQMIPDSEGFCCSCTPGNIFFGTPTRGNLACSAFPFITSQTAHCLGFDSLWYSLFEVGPPQVYYDIKVTISIPTSYAGSLMNASYAQTVLTLSQRTPKASALGGSLYVELIGDFATAVAPHSFESKYLAVPSRPQVNPRVDVTRPLRNAMIVDKSRFDLSGRTCDKIGISFPAFKWQSDKCSAPAGSCVHSQLDDLYLEDLTRISNGKVPAYLVSGFCDGLLDLTTTGDVRSLSCPLTVRQTTLMTLEARADSTMFVKNVANGKILSTSAPAFEALSGGGEVDISVLSTGTVTADFTIGVANCSTGLVPSPAVRVSLLPFQGNEAKIKLTDSRTGGGQFVCSAGLWNALGDLIDTQTVKINISSMQVTSGMQAPVDRGGAIAVDGDIISRDCSAICPAVFDVVCFLAHSCWGRLATFLGLILGALLLCCCCFAACRYGLPCKCMRCLSKVLGPASPFKSQAESDFANTLLIQMQAQHLQLQRMQQQLPQKLGHQFAMPSDLPPVPPPSEPPPKRASVRRLPSTSSRNSRRAKVRRQTSNAELEKHSTSS